MPNQTRFIASIVCWRRDSILTTWRPATRAVFAPLPRRIRPSAIPKKRAQYDVIHERRRQQRWRLVSHSARAENDFDAEKIVRLTILEVLYAKRRTEPYEPGISQMDLEEISGRAREHLEFTIWYLLQKKLISRRRQYECHDHGRRRGIHRGELPSDARDTPVAGGPAMKLPTRSTAGSLMSAYSRVHERIAVVRRRIEVLLDRPRADPPRQIQFGTGLVVRS